MKEREKDRGYKVVVNHKEQYSIWPADRKSPLGWRHVGILGTRGDCFAFIEKVWIGARPLSLQRKIGGAVNRL